MASETIPLVEGAFPRNAETLPETFITTTPPVIFHNTIVVAAAHPTLSIASQTKQGWFLSDFYAFNYLLRGLGASQTWLTAVDPYDLLDRYVDEGPYLHGNPYQTRRVVLSRELLHHGELSPVTVVKASQMVSRFLKEARRASERARKENGHVLLLVFCHGDEDYTLQLAGQKKEGLSIQQLRGALEFGSRVTLVTTACYSGGWAVTPDLNSTALTGASQTEMSDAWNGSNSFDRVSGSVFASTLIKTLSDAASPLVERLEAATEQSPGGASLQPKDPTEQQTETYNSFCQAVLDTCKDKVTRLWEKKGFSFSAQDDGWENSWTRRSGVPLADFEARWNKLVAVSYTGPADVKSTRDQDPSNPYFQEATHKPQTAGGAGERTPQELLVDNMTAAIQDRDAMKMAQLLLQTCYGDWDQGVNVGLRGELLEFIKGTADPRDEDTLTAADVISTVGYRWNAGLLADYVVEEFGLPVPSGAMCLLWEPIPWWRSLKDEIPDMKQREDMLYSEFTWKGEWPKPSRDHGQGPNFPRPKKYIIAALVEARMNQDETMEVAARINNFMESAAKFHLEKAVRDHGVRKRAGAWLKSVGRKIRRVFSPGASGGAEPSG